MNAILFTYWVAEFASMLLAQIDLLNDQIGDHNFALTETTSDCFVPLSLIDLLMNWLLVCRPGEHKTIPKRLDSTLRVARIELAGVEIVWRLS